QRLEDVERGLRLVGEQRLAWHQRLPGDDPFPPVGTGSRPVQRLLTISVGPDGGANLPVTASAAALRASFLPTAGPADGFAICSTRSTAAATRPISSSRLAAVRLPSFEASNNASSTSRRRLACPLSSSAAKCLRSVLMSMLSAAAMTLWPSPQ